MRACIFAVVLCASSAALAAPPYPLDGLLRRSKTVFLGDIVESDEPTVTLRSRKQLRGKPPAPLRLTIDAMNRHALPEGVNAFLVISQGDDHWGPPAASVTVDQGMEGQASYRGWIMFPLMPNGEVAGAFLIPKTGKFQKVNAKDLAKIVAHAPFKPDNP